MNKSPHQSSRNFGLDLLRCLAISLVLTSHVLIFFPLELDENWAKIGLFTGYLGVELFFVLSGFLIGQILIRLLENGLSLRNIRVFWIRRWFRTLPNYYLFLVLYLVAAHSGFGNSAGSFGHLVFLQNLAWPPSQFFQVSWSLAIEEWFYLLIPLGLLYLNRDNSVGKRAVFTLVLGGCLIVIALRFLHCVANSPPWDDGVRKVVFYRVDSLLIGVGAAAVRRYVSILWGGRRAALMFAGSLGIISSTWFFFSVDLDSSLFSRVFLFSLFSLAIAFCLPYVEGVSIRGKYLRESITRMSIWSYSIYLFHGLLLEFVIAHRQFLSELAPPLLSFFLAAYLGLSIGISALIYRYFEQPIMALRERFS